MLFSQFDCPEKKSLIVQYQKLSRVGIWMGTTKEDSADKSNGKPLQLLMCLERSLLDHESIAI